MPRQHFWKPCDHDQRVKILHFLAGWPLRSGKPRLCGFAILRPESGGGSNPDGLTVEVIDEIREKTQQRELLSKFSGLEDPVGRRWR